MKIKNTVLIGQKIPYDYLLNSSGKVKEFFIPDGIKFSRATTIPLNGFAPNTLYVLDLTEEESLTITLASSIEGMKCSYEMILETGENAPSVTFPEGLVWKDGTAPTISASKKYYIRIVEGLARYEEYYTTSE